MNSFGNLYRLTSFGESHGTAIGGVIDGVPSRLTLSMSKIQEALDRRRPGTSASVSQRREADRLEILSGVMADETDPDILFTLGTPIGFIVRNSDARSQDYEQLRNIYRPNHADYTYDKKYGIRDWRGGGRASGRETISRVVAGAIAEQLLEKVGIRIDTRVTQIGECSDPELFADTLRQVRASDDSLGGIVSTVVTGVPAGLGEPTFGKLQQMLASAMLSIGGVHGFEYGDGFALAAMRGSEAADIPDGSVTNHCGGILGGISNGAPIRFRVAFKPTPSISLPLPTITSDGERATLSTAGRHDPCIAVRGCSVVRAMTSIVLLDALLLSRLPLKL